MKQNRDPQQVMAELTAKARKDSQDLRRMAEERGTVPVRNSTMPACSNVAWWLKAGAVREGADDNLAYPSRRADGLHYRDGRIVTK